MVNPVSSLRKIQGVSEIVRAVRDRETRPLRDQLQEPLKWFIFALFESTLIAFAQMS